MEDLKCSECSSKFLDIKEFIIHRLSHKELRAEISPIFSDFYYCPLCSKSEHLCSCTYSLKRIAKRAFSLENISDDITKGSYLCFYCNYNFSHASDLAKHLNSHNLEQCDCVICHKKFPNHYRFHEHTKHHAKDDQLYLCTICSKVFVTKLGLLHHKNVHYSNHPLTCRFCDKLFSNQEDINKHIEKYHGSNRKQFSCLECGKKFSQIGHYNRHMHQVHETKETLTCHICLKLFSNSITLRRHLMIHTGECFECPYCLKKFAQKNHCQQHIKVLHETNKKRFACPICKKLYSCREYLKRHEKIHTNEEALRCTFCEKIFSSKNVCNRHIETIHTKAAQKSQCVTCLKFFSCYQYLIKHNKRTRCKKKSPNKVKKYCNYDI